MLSLAWPWLLLLLPLPWLRKPASPQTSGQTLRVPFFQRAQSLLDQHSYQSLRATRVSLPQLLMALAWICLVIALCRPQWQGQPLPLQQPSHDIMLAVDISGSMREQDLTLGGQSATRLQVVQSVISDFIQARQGDRLGLILFGSQAYLQAPLTYDLTTVARFLEEARIGFAGKQTAIGDAVGLAIKRLQDHSAESKILILLSDGANTSGEVQPLQAAELAAEADITLYTVGVGADEMLVQSLFGRRRINPSADLDETTLTQMAELTGGNYFRARSRQELAEIYQLIDQAQPILQQRVYRLQHEYYWLALLAALASMLTAWLLHTPLSRVWRRD